MLLNISNLIIQTDGHVLIAVPQAALNAMILISVSTRHVFITSPLINHFAVK
jgi:hypothetical protein